MLNSGSEKFGADMQPMLQTISQGYHSLDGMLAIFLGTKLMPRVMDRTLALTRHVVQRLLAK